MAERRFGEVEMKDMHKLACPRKDILAVVVLWFGLEFQFKHERTFINGPLNTHWYREDILAEVVATFSTFIGNNIVFMNDNLRLHIARIVTNYLKQVGIIILEFHRTPLG